MSDKYIPCIVHAIAAIMRRDAVGLAELIRPDYDKVIYPGRQFPDNLRGILIFDVQLWLVKQGYCLAHFDFNPEVDSDFDPDRVIIRDIVPDCETYIRESLALGIGILTTKTHAIAWFGDHGINGFRKVTVHDVLRYEVTDFYLLTPLPRRADGVL